MMSHATLLDAAHTPHLGPRPTTVVSSPRLSEAVGCAVTVVSEAFQYTGSFKFRAAWQVASRVPHPSILTSSSGNFGQAMAYACQLLGKGCTVVMPEHSARVKIDAVRAYGATVELFDAARTTYEARVEELALQHPTAYVASAYNDPLVIRGNASLGSELVPYAPHLDVLVAPIGGGGLTSGILTGLREGGASLPVVAAEPLLANDFACSLRAGRIVEGDPNPRTLADGARVRSVGLNNWSILQHGIAGVVEVPEAAIEAAVRLYFQLANLKVEPTGALSLAAVLSAPEQFRGQRVGCVVSGGNVDPAVYVRLLQDATR